MASDVRPVVVITPSYRRDFELFCELHESFLENFSRSAIHVVAVPPDDVKLFNGIQSAQLEVVSQLDLMPDDYRYVGSVTRRLATMLRRPVIAKLQYVHFGRRPALVRGWIAQQAVKLSLAAGAASDSVLIVDSDVVFIRSVTVSDFQLMANKIYLARAAIGVEMPEHRNWHRSAEALLSLPHDDRSRLDDYISPCVPWNTLVVRRALNRVSQAHKAGWLDAVLRSRDFSECIFYGRFAESGWPEDPLEPIGELALCYWSTNPLNEAEENEFLANLEPTHIALQIQSTSSTPIRIRRKIAAGARELHRSGDFGSSL